MKKVLILGGGALSTDLISTLLYNGVETTCLTRGVPNTNLAQCEFIHGDLRDKETYRYLQNRRFDAAIYIAATWRGNRQLASDYYDNLIPFKNFMKTYSNYIDQIVLISSSAANIGFDRNCRTDIKEVYLSYGSAKFAMENILASFDGKSVILRPHHIICPGEQYSAGRSHVITDFIYKRKNNIPIFLTDSIYVPFLDAQDLANVISKIIERSMNLLIPIHIGPRYEYSLNYALSIIDRELGLSDEIIGEDKRATNAFEYSYSLFGNYDHSPLDLSVKKGIEIYEERATSGVLS